MSFDVFSFGPACDSDVQTAFNASARTLKLADFNADQVLPRATAFINGGNCNSVVCSVSPPAPLMPLDLLSSLAPGPSCPFFLHAHSQAEFDQRIPDPQLAQQMGATGFLIGLSPTDIKAIIEAALTSGNAGLV